MGGKYDLWSQEVRGSRLQIDWQEDERRRSNLYKQEEDHQNRTRLQDLCLLRQGHPMQELAQVVEVHYRTLQDWIAWHRQG